MTGAKRSGKQNVLVPTRSYNFNYWYRSSQLDISELQSVYCEGQDKNFLERYAHLQGGQIVWGNQEITLNIYNLYKRELTTSPNSDLTTSITYRC